MKQYKHILLPIDFSNSSRNTTAQAMDLQKMYGCKLTVITFVEPIIPVAYGAGVMDLEAEMYERAQAKMQKWCDEFGIAKDDTRVESGRAKLAILKAAEDLNVDLIVIGSHGHHGMVSSILGSTAAAVADHAKCDVFLVRDNDD